jgi:glycosyltransferase involved in cell wall biosynthesis
MNALKHIYCYPFTDVGNSYINKNVELWQSMGHVVKSCPDALIRDWRVPRADKTIVLNWYEDWMLRSNRNPMFTLLWALLLLGIFSLSARTIIWVRHNYRPHDSRARTFNQRILAYFLGKAARNVVTLRPVADIHSDVIPHPLVIDLKNQPVITRDIDFIWFGMVREYKGLDHLLRSWPHQKSLLMLGQSHDPILSGRLLSIISDRQLDRVAWHNRFIPDDELNQLLLRTKFVVLAHDDQTIIVSGAFYHAIACGANVVVRDSDFGRFVAAHHCYAHLVDMSALNTDLEKLDYVPANNIQNDAERLYGDPVCRNAWASV